jgi:transcriptional regulator with XRE-family HTH domain
MPPVPRSTLGDNLARLRKARGLSQEKLAERSGVHRTVIAKIEAGMQEGISIENLGALADALTVQVGELTDPVGGPSPIAPLVPELEESGLLVPPLSDEERAWLLSLPPIVWLDREPSPATLYHMVQARRSGAPRQG